MFFSDFERDRELQNEANAAAELEARVTASREEAIALLGWDPLESEREEFAEVVRKINER